MNLIPHRMADIDLTNLHKFAHGFPHDLFAIHPTTPVTWDGGFARRS